MLRIVNDILATFPADIRETGSQHLKNFQDILLWLELERKLYEKERRARIPSKDGKIFMTTWWRYKIYLEYGEIFIWDTGLRAITITDRK